MKTALTIAGFDPSGGAGIQQDLRVFRSFGIYGLSVASALTAQNSRGVFGVMPVGDRFLKKQLTVLLSDFKPDATKIGMLYSAENVEAVAHIIRKYSLTKIVVDPVLLSSSGKSLAKKETMHTLKQKLLPLCTVFTPNIHEASVLSGVHIKTRKDMEIAAVRLKDHGAESVIITGGHLEKTAMDVVYNGEFHYLESKKIRGEYHGTGCAFSSALAALLAGGHDVLEASGLAKKFMDKLFKKSFGTGKGMRLFII